ncbi:DUF1476 domain-containing protein [Celeribacter neptunius]|uniref:DUF1476 domain-containing protein n=1 Tax=Celeribacter neptunius TaxID=588602 RepID=A0A1I3K5Q4_9RHOB|nr:DUF1476 domain-containing protein [Celeribacter neptunius]SFI67829.1 hypothetical protein SAMN04487991_0581 [Celeribacter neptunius]
MTTFDEREAGYENKFAHDATTRFKLESRADRKLAHWAGAQLGKTGAVLEAYVRDVIRADLKEAGAEDVIAKVTEDLGPAATAMTVREKYAAFLADAKAELATG